MRDLVRAAARNNAEWCDLVCGTHGLAGTFTEEAWTVPRRSPPFYPDAVTLEPTATASVVLAPVDASPGCSIKDSFACLDLAAHEFGVLFEATWIHRPAGVGADAEAPGLRWEPVTDAGALADWGAAWGESEPSTGLFRPELLARDDVLVLGGFDDGGVVAGAIANLAASVVGVSNVFAAERASDAAWAGILRAIDARWPGVPLVGYERGDELEEASRHGFAAIGPLRVWIAEDLDASEPVS